MQIKRVLLLVHKRSGVKLTVFSPTPMLIQNFTPAVSSRNLGVTFDKKNILDSIFHKLVVAAFIIFVTLIEVHRGLRHLEFASTHKRSLANTLVHPRKLSRRTTWHSPNGKIHYQIDYILVPRRFKSSINKANTRTFPGAAT